jgi:outer membrane protein assembly factor BamB
MSRLKACLIAAVVISFSVAVCAESAEGFWPTWRGPASDGIAPGGDPPTTWSETENIQWKVPITTDGSVASPIIWGNKIFFQTAVKTDKTTGPAQSPAESEQAPPPPPAGDPEGPRPPRGPGEDKPPKNFYQFNLVCMDRNTGKVLWEKTACEAVPHQGHQPSHGFASYSPVTDGRHVWANFGSRGLYCYDMDGNLIWKQDLVRRKTMFGEGGSLALVAEAVVVVADGDEESWIFAFRKNTGELLWKKQRDEKTTYGTPLAVTLDGQLQVITSGINKIRSYDPAAGDLLWECAGLEGFMIPTPVVGFDLLLCAVGGHGKGRVAAIRLEKAGGQAIAWQTSDLAPFVTSPLLYGPRLYVYAVNPPSMSCFDAGTGRAFYLKQPLEQFKEVYASPVGAADRIYLAGRNGITYVLKNAETFEVLAVNKLEDEFSCTPAVAGDALYLKGRRNFYCIEKSK